MKKATERTARIAEPGWPARTAVFWLCVAEIVLVPLPLAGSCGATTLRFNKVPFQPVNELNVRGRNFALPKD
jgi:hypothetical protein